MCDLCEEVPVQFVAYFNKAGGTRWRPPRQVATPPGATGVWPQQFESAAMPVMLREVRQFSCDDSGATTPTTEQAV